MVQGCRGLPCKHEAMIGSRRTLSSWLTYRPIIYQKPYARPQFSRHLVTKEQFKTAQLQKSPHIPNQIVTEVPHSNQPSFVEIPSQLWYHRMGSVRTFLSWLSRMQRNKPLTTTLATSLTTYLCGDILAQEIGGERYDGTRTLRMLAIGAVVSIPGYKWFMFLGSHFNYRSKIITISLKVAIQQFFFAPIFNTYFFGMQAVLAGQPPSAVLHRIMEAVPESVVSSAKFWPAVTALNFTVIPPPFRFMFSGVFAVIWQTYLSFLNRRTEKEGPTMSLADEARQKLFEESKTGSEH